MISGQIPLTCWYSNIFLSLTHKNNIVAEVVLRKSSPPGIRLRLDGSRRLICPLAYYVGVWHYCDRSSLEHFVHPLARFIAYIYFLLDRRMCLGKKYFGRKLVHQKKIPLTFYTRVLALRCYFICKKKKKCFLKAGGEPYDLFGSMFFQTTSFC